MRQAKILGWVISGLFALFVVVLAGIWLFVNPNHYKPTIIAAVKKSTGRDLSLPGEIKLSVFPWIALELGHASLGNPPGFGTEPFLSFEHAAVRVKLLPLLQERLEIARVEIDGLDLRLTKNADGKGNWHSPTATPAPQAEPAATDDGGALRAWDSLADIRIRRGRVSYQHWVIEHLDFETGSAGSHREIPVNIGFDANRGVSNKQLNVNAKFHVSRDTVHDQLQFAAINLSGTLSRPNDGRPVHWDVSAPALDLNLDEETLSAPAFALTYSSGRVTGTLSATHILGAPSASGSLSIGPLVLHEFVPRLGLTLPATRDPKAFSDLSGSTEFAYDPRGLTLDKLNVRLDDSQLNGTLQWLDQPVPALKFDLTMDLIDLNRYAGPPTTAPYAANRDSAPTAAALEDPAPSLTLDGNLRLGSVRFSQLDLTGLSVKVTSNGGVTHLFPIEAQIDGGHYAGDITYDGHGGVPTIKVDEHLAGVDMALLLANTAQKGRLSGRANFNIKADAQGGSSDAMLKSMDGHLDANLADGAIEGIDVGYQLGVAQALMDRQTPSSREDTKRTKFTEFKMSAQITNGIAETHDLAITSEVLKVSGQGTANLPTKAIDFALLASVLKSATVTAVEVPLEVTGTYANPTLRPDVNALAKGQLKQKLQDVLKKNGLEGLFGH